MMKKQSQKILIFLSIIFFYFLFTFAYGNFPNISLNNPVSFPIDI